MSAADRELADLRLELREREEEIQLLHAITETLGGVSRIEDATAKILEEVVRVTGAERASLWTYEPGSTELLLAASVGLTRPPVTRIPISSDRSVSALVFREQRPIRLEELERMPGGLMDRFTPKPESWLGVPISYTSPGGSTRTVGVLNLIGRAKDAVVSPDGEARLITTLARQIGSAIENIRLFKENLARERLMRELKLAHDLQMKLLPDIREFHDIADVAARCVPARPVGGDFYQLFKLPEGRIGALLGDVASHGFGAALIMALSMSAAGIYARAATAPGDLLRAVHRALIQKLESTEMFMTLFYGVIDPAAGTLRYANAGHAHAFRVHGDAEPQRLVASSPPLGIAEYESYGELEGSWEPGDVLCVFTDGLTSPAVRTTEAELVSALSAGRRDSAQGIVDALFGARRGAGGPASDDQTALVIRA